MQTGLDLKLDRVRRGLRQADVAALAGISRQRVSALESRTRLTPESAARLGAAIDGAIPGTRGMPGELIDLDRRREQRRQLMEAEA